MPLPRLGKRAHGTTFRLLLQIDSNVYTLLNLHPDPRVATAAWRLTKANGKGAGVAYDVSHDEHGLSCTCEDWLYRASKVGEPCKHLRSLNAVGLI